MHFVRYGVTSKGSFLSSNLVVIAEAVFTEHIGKYFVELDVRNGKAVLHSILLSGGEVGEFPS